jgi:conjugative transfer pilus assembly protein TraH
MLAVGNTIPGSGLADTLIAQYRDVIAVDYAYVFLERNFRVGMQALSTDYQLNREQKETARELRGRVLTYLAQITSERQRVSAKVASFSLIASDLERLERELRAHLPQHVMDMLGQQAAYLGR